MHQRKKARSRLFADALLACFKLPLKVLCLVLLECRVLAAALTVTILGNFAIDLSSGWPNTTSKMQQAPTSSTAITMHVMIRKAS